VKLQWKGLGCLQWAIYFITHLMPESNNLKKYSYNVSPLDMEGMWNILVFYIFIK
jgi:hypothetical protein